MTGKRMLFVVLFLLSLCLSVLPLTQVRAQAEATPLPSADVGIGGDSLFEAAPTTPPNPFADAAPATREADSPADENAVEATEAPVPVNVDVTINNPTPLPEPDEPPVDWVTRTSSIGAIISVIIGLILYFRDRRDASATLQEANARLTADTGLQADIRTGFGMLPSPAQDFTLKLMSLVMLATNWTPGQDDDALARNVNAVLTGQPLTPPVPEASVPPGATPETAISTPPLSIDERTNLMIQIQQLTEQNRQLSDRLTLAMASQN